MLRIFEDPLRFERLPNLTLTDLGYLERQHLQRLIREAPDQFFAEMGEKLLLVAEEVQPSDFVQNRIDLLAIDPLGNLVILELKRNNNRLQLLQALSYAAMISSWTQDEVFDAFKAYNRDDEESDKLREFLDDGLDSINSEQRIILISEEFDFEVLVTAEWLTERYGMSVQCYRLQISKDEEAKYLSCTGIYPPPEIRDHAVSRGSRSTTQHPKWTDWEEALSNIQNGAVVEFFKSQLAAGAASNLSERERYLRYSVGGNGRFFVSARTNHAYVWQEPRFENDNEFWCQRLSSPDQVVDVKRGDALRFWLVTAEDFDQFARAVDIDLQQIEFS